MPTSSPLAWNHVTTTQSTGDDESTHANAAVHSKSEVDADLVRLNNNNGIYIINIIVLF